MEPALENGELVVIKKTTKIKQGDIIGFYYQSKILVKRVIGTAGDYIDIDEDGNVYVNGEKLDEPYAMKKDYKGNVILIFLIRCRKANIL